MDRNAGVSTHSKAVSVALRKESVDRNILTHATSRASPKVALRKESVDRNTNMMESSRAANCRSPQGERG